MLSSWCNHCNMTIVRLPTWSYSLHTSHCYRLDSTVLMLPSLWYCPKTNIPMLPSQCYCSNTTIKMLMSWCHHHDAIVSMLPSWCYPLDVTVWKQLSNATISMLPSQCYHPDATILTLLTQHYYLPHAAIPMQPSDAWCYHSNATI